MLNTVKHAMYTLGDGAGDLAKSVGCGTAQLARRVGDGSADLARRIDPKRAIIGFAVLGVLVGGSIWLVRYLRARKEDLPFEATDEQAPGRPASRPAKPGAEQFSH